VGKAGITWFRPCKVIEERASEKKEGRRASMFTLTRAFPSFKREYRKHWGRG